ncbi:MAG: DUF420 domain-containing protein [Candidatus Zixiibacteriota bacterium]
MIELKQMPALNASLNGLAGVFLLAGYFFIRRKKISAHRACMIAAISCSTLFLSSYLYYHFHAGTTRFAGEGWSRPLYFTILFTHTPLAAVVLPLAIVTVTRAFQGNFAKHRKIARWTWPLWMYVSVTGVLIYFMLYQWFPG